MSTKLPIFLYDLGAAHAADLDFSRAKLWSRMGMRMGQKAAATPVYLVSRSQMDLLAPPKRFCFLDPDQVAIWARRIRDLQRELDRDVDRKPLQDLDLQCEGPYRDFVAAGLYMYEPPSDDKWKKVLALSDSGCSPDPSAVNPPSGPSIYLCPERIVRWADKVGVSHELVLDKVYYHELGHALMDTGPTPYGELWCRIVEESLANWIAFSCFKGLEARWVQRIIQGQPAEYRGYAHLGEALLSSPQWRYFPVRTWPPRVRRLFIHIWEEWREWEEWVERVRRRGWPLLLLPRLAPAYSDEEILSRQVYNAWRRAKRHPMEEDFWAAYAENILLETFA